MKSDCNKCIFLGKEKYKVCGCVLWECKKRGEVPFWTNKKKLLATVECDKFRTGKDLIQLELDFN